LHHETQDDEYEIVQINISDSEKEKLKNVIENNEIFISIKLSHADLMGDDTFLVTKKQFSQMTKALNSKRMGVILILDKNQIEANINAAISGGNIFSGIWTFLKNLFSKAVTAAPGIAKNVASKAVAVAPTVAKNVGIAAAEHGAKMTVEKVADKILGDGITRRSAGVSKKKKLILHLASKDAGNTGLEHEIEKLLKK